MIIERVPDEVRRQFKIHCAEMGISMREAIIRLMGLEAEKRILFSPIDVEKEDKKGV